MVKFLIVQKEEKRIINRGLIMDQFELFILVSFYILICLLAEKSLVNGLSEVGVSKEGARLCGLALFFSLLAIIALATGFYTFHFLT